MLTNRFGLSTALAALTTATLVACGGPEAAEPQTPIDDSVVDEDPAPVDDEQPSDDPELNPSDEALLEQYRAAIPTMQMLEAGRPGSANMQALVGDPAEYPQHVIPQVTAINQQVRGIIQTLETIVALPPTFHNSETREFVWGPWDNEDTALEGDSVLAYIRDMGEEANPRYHYALARGVGQDTSTLVPVVYGATQPDADNPEHGGGFAVYDLVKNRAFDEAQGLEGKGSGRFAVLFARDQDENEPDNTNTLVVAAFRDFRGEEVSDDAPGANMNHLYGRVENPEGSIDFVSIQALADIVPEGGDGIPEVMEINTAFLNESLGRGESIIAGGSLAEEGSEVDVVLGAECWDPSLSRTFFALAAVDQSDAQSMMATEGDAASCGAFNASLDDLNIPTLDNADPELTQGVIHLAENGIDFSDDSDS